MINLPDNPSGMIRLAIFSLEKCESSPDYEIDWSAYLLPGANGFPTCVDLAGAIMAQAIGKDVLCSKLNWDGRGDIAPFHLFYDIKGEIRFAVDGIDLKKVWLLLILDDFRTGNWIFGCKRIGVKCPRGLIGFDLPIYEFDAAAFKRGMLRAADIFEEAGL